ncbi:unnamed protein product [Symbiodinium pilosum]|uniref:Sulfite exporter TauE/SafE n=1 Tax=Symbiodinium pilosum TaxID=2952 RepID=A0A812TAM2_SYMPI|nr:unnamed protein product [Symbiodinium pilosum]
MRLLFLLETLAVAVKPPQALLAKLIAEPEDQFFAQPAENEHDQGPPRPFWVFDADALATNEAWNCAFVMAAAGILCAAGGIGGGGIYVTVLMVAGGLPVRDAVPLSKAVVFIGSISSLFLNLRKAAASSDALIDYNVCRLVVPAALVGTYLGVLLNSLVPTWAVLLALVGILVAISYMILRTTWQQYAEEEHFSHPPIPPVPANSLAKELKTESVPEVSVKCVREVQTVTRTDVILSAAMLFVVVTGSAFRHHAMQCQKAHEKDREKACHHPTLFWLESATLLSWMQSPTIAAFIKVFFFLGPMLLCLLVLGYVAKSLANDGWSSSLLGKFSLMSATTGCLAGFVGIGGGLIFSPYFLLMGLEPAVAVATSSTCVIFTASSTTFQYLLTDRVIMSLTLLYGTINLVSSYLGTSLVHCLQDHLSARRSAISGIVSLGVVISTILALRQLTIEVL